MSRRAPQTFAKRAREQAVKEKRDLKRAAKEETKRLKKEGITPGDEIGSELEGDDVVADSDAPLADDLQNDVA